MCSHPRVANSYLAAVLRLRRESGALPLDEDEDEAVAVADEFEDRGMRVKNVTVDGDTVTVVMERDVDLPFGGPFGLDSWHVEAEATARSMLR